jgi:hypothetical protein
MAGAGYKLFNTGDVLTAAQVNTYLQEQTVMVFANSTARTTALSGVLAEGMMSYLQDTNAVQVYNGSSWVSVGGSSPLTTKGDLYGFSTVDARIPIGANGTVLTADSSEALGLKWATPAGGGKILQVVQGNTSTATTSTSNTYIDTNLSASITPAATSSKVLVIVSLMGIQTAANNTGISPKLVRGATDIVDYFAMPQIPENGSGHGAEYSWNFSYLDSPSTTSSTTYKIQFKSFNGATVKVQNNSVNSYIQLLEVGA